MQDIKHLRDIDLSKLEVRPKSEGKYIVDLNPAGYKLTYTVSAESEEQALEKIKELLRKQIKRTGYQPKEGKK